MKRVFLFVSAILLVMLTACSPKTESSPESVKTEYRTISAEGVKTLLDNKRAITLIDVRRTDEYEAGHIPSAIHIANEDIGDTRPEQLSDLDATIIIYCRSGRRSEEAANKLINLGYTDVRDLGGIDNWTYSIVTGSEAGTWTTESTEDTVTGILSRFSATDLNGTVIDESMLSDYNLTMVNVWATFCGPCLREMPDLGELAEEYKAQGVQIVGMISDVLNSDGSLSQSQVSTAKDIVNSTKANYLHILPSEDLFGLLSQITSVPTTFFVDKDGNQVGQVYVGSNSKADWKSIIDQTMKEVSK